MTNPVIRALIADDEQSCREILRHYLSRYCSHVSVVGEAHDVKDCISKISTLKPDLVFLDVEMPFGNAFDVLEQTADIPYKTIFVTAFSEYAMRALNASASYYLLKPLNIDELIRAVEKVSAQDQNPQQMHAGIIRENLNSGKIHKILIPTLSGFEVLKTEEIIRLSGNGNYTDLFLSGQRKKTVSRVLKHFEELLQADGFLRVHKSHLVNMNYAVAWHRGKGGFLELSDGTEVEVSPQRKDEVLSRLGGGAGFN
ncbi:MAG: LytTR family DNA-binding domain-containing protein [Bacteroidetes bacterium]|nr:LytTR family DNA-binding domain-containing protein [Bacteroidota bacterium]